MEEKYSLKSDSKIVLCIITVLSVMLIVCAIISSFGYSDMAYFFLRYGALIFLSLATLYYAFIGYKVPHGNHMKHLLIIYALLTIFNNSVGVVKGILQTAPQTIASFVMVLGSSFMAGRLHKYKENVVIIVIVAIASLTLSISSILTTNNIQIIKVISLSHMFIIWICLSLAYLVRYKAHKEAGMLDSNEKR